MGSSNLISVGTTLQDLRRAVQKLASLRLNADATPTFGSVVLDNLTPNRLTYSDADKLLSSVAVLSAWVAGTTNQVSIADDGDGSITLSLPQDIHTAASPTFTSLTLSAISNETTDVDKFLVDSSGVIKYRTGAELLADIGGSSGGAHTHDGDTLQHDAVNSDGGAFNFTTTGLVAFNQSIESVGLIPTADNAHDIGLVEEEEGEDTLQIEQSLSNGSTTVTIATYLGVTFMPLTGFTITQAAFKLRRGSGGIGNLTMHLTATDGTDPVGGDLASVTVAGADAIPNQSQDTWVIFTFDTPYLLTQDVKYAIFMTLDSAASNKYTQYYYSNQQVLDDSEYLQNAGSGWQNIPTFEGTFRIYSAGETASTYTRWHDLFLSGVFNDGTVSLSVANAKAAYDFTTALNAATDGQLMIGDTGDNPILATLTGTADQIVVTGGAGSITLSTPQDIDVAADVQFDSANITNTTTVGRLLAGGITEQ